MKKTKKIVLSVIVIMVLAIISGIGYWVWKYYFLPDVDDQKGKDDINS